MKYDGRDNNQYRFDSFGNVGKPTTLDVAVEDHIEDNLPTLDIIEDNKQYFYNNIKWLDCYFFTEHVIRILGQPLPVYSIKKPQEEQASPFIKYYRNGEEIKSVRLIVNKTKYYDSMPYDATFIGGHTYDIGDLFYQWRTDPNYSPLEIRLKTL